MATHKTKKILIAPLDWGLGHTARCIPIIEYLRSAGHHPIVAGNPSQLLFLTSCLGDLATVHLEGYNIRYSRWNRWAQAGLLSQLPRIARVINDEQKWLQEQASQLKLDGIISDNRYGLFHTEVPAVIMTHQLQVLSGLGSAADNMVKRLHYKMLNRFNETWVVDTQHAANVAGSLSHPDLLPARARYLGLLSRYADEADAPVSGRQAEPQKHLLILLSGPEPLRTALSQMLWKQAVNFDGKITFIEGSEAVQKPHTIPHHVTYHQRIGGNVLLKAFKECDIAICRSGYSTIMDLVALQCKAIVIPTPGQTEQLYLGKHLHERGVFYCAQQDGFDLQNALMSAENFPFHLPGLNNAYDQYKPVLDDWLSKLS